MALPRGARKRGAEALARCRAHYAPRYAFLRHETPFQLLVAVVLSARTRDATVNEATPALFARYPTAEKLARATPAQVDRPIAGIGFHRQKAERLVALARLLVERHDGEVPLDLDALTALPGVGRKTANVVLAHVGGAHGIAVDTHVARVARRLALTAGTTPEAIEGDLLRVFDEDERAHVSYELIQHGRAVCHARRPLCGACFLDDVCPKKGVDRRWVAESRRLAAEGRLAPTPDALREPRARA